MSDYELSPEAAALLRKMYRQYISRIKHGDSWELAVLFGDNQDIVKTLSTNKTPETVERLCWELYDHGLVDCIPGDDGFQLLDLTRDGIQFCQNRFRGIVSKLLSLLKTVLPFIPLGG